MIHGGNCGADEGRGGDRRERDEGILGGFVWILIESVEVEGRGAVEAD